ncbi:MFS transporter [Rhodococcus sp. USK13]|uniref:MFS transporter n=1 Tax=Rhodococcus sp. USK13 TaxID=2806442 RepID=UPI0024B5A201|nr:MFS transporter [Rhodococcus sp. USK13]
MFSELRAHAQRRGIAAFLACTAQFLSALNMGIGPLMIPSVAADLGFGPVGQAWVVSGYALAFAGFVLLGGRLADVFGGGRTLMLGYAAAMLSACAATIAPSTAIMIGARIGQGVGAAITVPAALAILATSQRGLSGRSRVLALFAASGGIGFGLGLAAGGLAADTVGWRWLFGCVAVLSALLVALTFVFVERTKRSQSRLNIWPSIWAAVGLVLIAYAVTIGPSSEGMGRASLVAALAGACLLAIFVRSQVRASDPIMPPELWARPHFALSIIATALIYGAWVSAYYFAALFLQDSLGLSATAAALVMAPLAFGAAAGSRIAAMILPRVSSPAILIAVGSIECAASITLLATPGLTSPWAIVLLLTLVVGGQTVAFVSLNVVALSVAEVSEMGMVGSVFNASCQVGGGFAVGILAAIASEFSGSAIADGYRVAFLCAALLALGAGIVASGSRIKRRQAVEVAPP